MRWQWKKRKDHFDKRHLIEDEYLGITFRRRNIKAGY
jgi:hypothetical protein